MITVTSVHEMQKIIRDAKPKDIGFVPTMGALHQGHLDLVSRCQSENAITIVSIFINPTQFNNTVDYAKYPKSIEQDQSLLKEAGVDYLFLPNEAEIYADGSNYSVNEKEKNSVLCGASRPGHFSGVLTVVLKLFQIIQPTRAYFGEKDYQQLSIIRGMVDAFFIPVQIVAVPTVRDKDGLALSSRNQRLSSEGLKKAREFAKILKETSSAQEAKKILETKKIPVDYVEDMWGRRFAAVFVENVRLIDNVPL
jgi:pantoate--beta-alanine ligase